jgi:hypothetical protein
VTEGSQGSMRKQDRDWNSTNAGPTLGGLGFETESLYNEAEDCTGERVILIAKLLVP